MTTQKLPICKLILSIVALVFFSSCSNSDASHDTQAIMQEVNEMFDKYVDYVNTSGLNGVEQYFSSDERFYWVEDGIMQYPDRETLLEGVESFHPSVISVDLEVFKKEIAILNHSTVSLYVEYKEEIVLKSGYVVKLDGAMTILTIREASSWKFLIGHSSIKKQRG